MDAVVTVAMAEAHRRVRQAARRHGLTGPQAQLVDLLLREDRRQRLATQQRLAECRRELRSALSPLAPDPVAVLELSVEERLLQERQAAYSAQLEQRVAAVVLVTCPPAARADRGGVTGRAGA